MTNKIQTDCGVMFADTIICQDSIVEIGYNGFANQIGTVAVALFDGWRPHWQVIFDLGSGWFGFPDDASELDQEQIGAWLPMIEATEALTADPEFEKVAADESIQWSLEWCHKTRRALETYPNHKEALCLH